MSENGVNRIKEIESEIDAYTSANSNVLVNNTGTWVSDGSIVDTTSSEINTVKYVAEQYEKQSEVTQKLLKELIAEIKDLKEEGVQQEREIEQIRKEFEEFKVEVEATVSKLVTSNNTVIATNLWSSCTNKSMFGHLSLYDENDSMKVDPIGEADIGGSSVSLKKLKMEREVNVDSKGNTVVKDEYTDGDNE